MDYKLLIDTAALAGMIMLENGAEIYRVESLQMPDEKIQICISQC